MSRWIGAAGKLLEVRSTSAGALEDVTLASRPVSADAEREEGIFSIVIPGSTGPIRRLPSLYVGAYQVFASRRIADVIAKLQQAIRVVVESDERPAYAARSCSFDGRRGLYTADFFNRSPLLRKLTRAGVTFSSDGYSYLAPDGTFYSDDLVPFRPDFVIMGSADTEDPDRVHEASPGWLAFNLAGLRIGRITPDELHTLRSIVGDVQAVGSGDPLALARVLRVSG